jgi:hypothetical protein
MNGNYIYDEIKRLTNFRYAYYLIKIIIIPPTFENIRIKINKFKINMKQFSCLFCIALKYGHLLQKCPKTK